MATDPVVAWRRPEEYEPQVRVIVRVRVRVKIRVRDDHRACGRVAPARGV